MANEPMPWQLTVGQLKHALQHASDDAVVGLKVPRGGVGHPDLETYINLAIHRSADPMVVLVPIAGPA